MSYYKWKPSKAAKQEFADKMNEIDAFCKMNEIDASISKDSYYFNLNGQSYRVSNHSVEASYSNSNGLYHEEGRRNEVIYIHASKTRLIQIYNDLKAGYQLDGRGNRKQESEEK